MNPKTIDIFCHVVDNYGDIGVVYRFAREFKRRHPECRVRVFVDDLNSLKSMHPEIDTHLTRQEHAGIMYIDTLALNRALVDELGTAHILVEAFACYIPEIVLDAASGRRTYIINIDHLSAEKWVEGYHLKESLLGRGELKKYFFMPGFTIDTGGVVVDTHIEAFRERLGHDRRAYLNKIIEPLGVEIDGGDETMVGTIFTYERRFDSLLDSLERHDRRTCLLVFDRKSIEGMKMTVSEKKVERLGEASYRVGNSVIAFLPFLPQQTYDELLCLADFNLVRGEDSLVRAILAEKPFIWHAYKQDNNYQMVKVKAFLEAIEPYFDDGAPYRRYHDTLMRFNDGPAAAPTGERFEYFIGELNKIGHATGKMSYFIRENCNLLKKFDEFLSQLP